MALMDWSVKLATGIGEIDAQHKRLVDMINGLHEAMKAGKSREMTGKLVEELKSYARTHFDTEERLMERHGYPELAAHRVEHNHFIEKILDFDLCCQEGAPVSPMEIMRFLTTWLTTHIQGTDQKYAPFLLGKGVR